MPRRFRFNVTRRPAALLGGLSALVLLVGLAACTSDESNPVGAGLGTAGLDTLMRELVVDDLVHLGQLEVTDPAKPLDQADVLYLGERAGDRSSILANFDFSSLSHPDSSALVALLNDDNVDAVDLKLIHLLWYEPEHAGLADAEDESYRPWAGAAKVFDVHVLSAPFDTLRYPDAEPEYSVSRVSLFDTPQGRNGSVLIPLDPAVVLQWVRDRARVGIIIREGAGSEPGLVGYASKEMSFGGSTLDQENVGTGLGPVLIFGMNQVPDDWPSGRQNYVHLPAADISTWHELQDTPVDPADGIEVRGHVRSYPVIRFEPGVLPESIRINLAQVVLHVDTSRTHGPPNILTVSEFALDQAPDGTRTRVILDDIEDEVELIGGGRVEPENVVDTVVRLNVTTALQRYVNGLQDQDAGFLIANGERFFSGFVSSPGPGFYFSRWAFHGTSAAEDLRPRLEILYTRVNELTDGEVR